MVPFTATFIYLYPSSETNLCGLAGAGLAHQHKALMACKDLMEALFVLPDRKLQTLLEDLIVAWRVG